MRYILAVFLLCISAAFANEDANVIVLPEEKVHEGDYFAGGGSIEVSGLVKGDVYVFGTHILIDGTVDGDVIASGGTIDIAGTIKGNVRLAGGQVEIEGTIERNATVFGGNVELSSGAEIRGNAVITGGVVDLAGTIGQNATLSASTLRISGKVGENIKAYVGQLRLSSKAHIGGNLEYSSSKEAWIDSGARIEGQKIYHPSVAKQIFRGKWREGMIFGSRMTGILMNFLFTFVIGIIVMKLFPRRLRGALDYLKKRPWKAFWSGILIAIFLPVACLILFITILGFPLALALVAISLLGFYSAKVFPIFFLSNKYLTKLRVKKNTLLCFFLGVIAFLILTQIPFLGGLISLIFTMLGLGAVVLGRIPRKKRT